MQQFEIDNDAIDTAALEAEIEARVEERRRSGAYSPEVEALLAERLPAEEQEGALPPLAALDYAAERAKHSWEVTTAYPVETEKAVLRPFIVFIKRIARLWARIAVGPIQREQTAFNRHAAGAVDAVRRQAVAERARALAAEADRCALAEALIEPADSEALAPGCATALAGAFPVTLVGPCPASLRRAIEGEGITLFVVAPGDAWDAPGAPDAACGPLSFLSAAAEGSIAGLLLPDTAFWLDPTTLARLARDAYLALAPGAPLAVAVHPFAEGDSPSWADRRVVLRALALAGFADARILEAGAGRGYVAAATR